MPENATPHTLPCLTEGVSAVPESPSLQIQLVLGVAVDAGGSEEAGVGIQPLPSYVPLWMYLTVTESL